MAQVGWMSKQSKGVQSLAEELTVITMDDNDEFIEEDDELDAEDEGKNITELFQERKFGVIKQRLLSGKVTEEDLTFVDENGSSMLDDAAASANIEIFSLILECTDYTKIPKYTSSPFQYAIKFNARNIFDLYLKTLGSSAEISMGDESEGNTPLHSCMSYYQNEIAEDLIKAGADIDAINHEGETPLYNALQSWNRHGTEILLEAGASVNHRNNNGKTPLHVTAAENYVDNVKLLLSANAEIDVKDNDGKHVIQVAENDEIKRILREERISRQMYPVHILARNGDLDGIQKWLAETTVKGPGISHVWSGQFQKDDESNDVELKLKLVCDVENRSYLIVGQYQDSDGIFYMSGKWYDGHIDIKKEYASDGYTLEYSGDIDMNTGEWVGEWNGGDETGEFYFSIPLYPCKKCEIIENPNENEFCFNCQHVDSIGWYGEYEENGEWNSLELQVVLHQDISSQTYRISGTGYGTTDETYTLSGAWKKDNSIKIAKHYSKETILYDGYISNKKWTGELIDSNGDVNSIRFDIPMYSCIECDEIIPIENSKCFNCNKKLIFNWKGKYHFDNESHDTSYLVCIGRDVKNKMYTLIGEGKDEHDDFDIYGRWNGKNIQCTKVYNTHQVEYDGEFNSETNEWCGNWIIYGDEGEEDTIDEFQFQIPMFSCYICEKSIPIQNGLCLTCNIDTPQWKPLNGSILHAWVGQCREERGDWADDEFSVKILRDVATDSYRFAGFDKDGAGYFASTGVWKGDDIYMERIYLTDTTKMEGKYDPVKSEWSGPNIMIDEDGTENKGRMRYTIPMWPCLKCQKPVPIENSLCFSCDMTPRNTVRALELPFDVATIRREIQARENISNLLNQMDRQGRTVLMYAAENGNLAMLEELLSYMSPADIRRNDNDGKSAMDIALARKLVCSKNPLNQTNNDVLNTIELLQRRGCLQIKPTTIPDTFENGKKCCGDCDKKSGEENEKENEISLYEMAKKKQWNELEELLNTTISSEKLNAKDTDSGLTLAHMICREGKVKLLKLLLEQPNIDWTIYNDDYKYPLYEAMKKDRVGCVQVMLHAGIAPTELEAFETNSFQMTLLNPKARCYKYIYDKYMLMERENLQLYYTANVASIQAAENYIAAKQTALHAAILNLQRVDVVDELTQDELIDVDAQDKNGDTALMIAVRGKTDLALKYVEILLAREADVDVVNHEGKSALMIATVAGHVDIVELLLKNMAEIDLEDMNGDTCLELVNKCYLGSGKTASNKSNSTPHAKIKDMLTVERDSRANSVDFRDKLAKTLMGMTPEEAFLQGGFRKAINCSPALARTFLDDSVVINRHDIVFDQMDEIYGEDAEHSALNAVLDLKSDDPEFILEARKECLEHVVMRRNLEIKWELFGLRKYMEQFMMNFLFLVTSTISSITFKGDQVHVRDGKVIVGITAFVLTIFTFIFVQLLRPQKLWQISRYFHDGSFHFDPTFEISDLAEKKKKARQFIRNIIIITTICTVIPLLILLNLFELIQHFSKFNNGVLWLVAGYFLITEFQELRAGLFKYFESNINKAQMSVYLIVFFCFVPMKLGIFQTDDAVQIGLGGFISLILWILTVQYLEVIPSASYLLPMMSNLLQDVWNFFILFSVFQMGLTITFYQLFNGQEDDAFNSLSQSFITTYFVAFGELPLDSVKSFNSTQGNFLPTCTVILIMFHAAVVVILLLNVLLAMMNKTVDVGFEKAKTEALASYGRCIYRLEESMNLTKEETMDLIYFKDEKNEKILNPIFHEHVAKSDIQIPDEQEIAITEYQNKKMNWIELLNGLNETINYELNLIFENLIDLQHFIQFNLMDVMENEIKLIEMTKKQLNHGINMAKKTRGQDPDNAMKKLDTTIKKTLNTFEDHFKHEWNNKKQSDQHKKCTILYPMTHKNSIESKLAELKTTIQSHIEAIMYDFKMKTATEPKLSAFVERFDTLDEAVKGIKPEDSSENDTLLAKVEEITQQNQQLTTSLQEMAEKLESLMNIVVEMKG